MTVGQRSALGFFPRDELLEIQLLPIELLLDALKGGVTNRSIRAQRDQPLPLGRRGSVDDGGVDIAGLTARRHRLVRRGVAAGELGLRALEEHLVSSSEQTRHLLAW